MKFLIALAIIVAEYYSFSYGLYLWKSEDNKLPALGVMLITALGIAIPIAELYLVL